MTSHNMKFKREEFRLVYEEMRPLLEKHWEEIAHYKDIPLNVDEESYNNLDRMQAIRIFTSRDVEGVLCGYAVFFVKHNIHYKDSIQAVQDVIFIHPEKRGFGRDFIAWCDNQLKAEGVQAVYHHIKQAKNWGPMLEKQGYELVDLIYAKRLDKVET